MSSSSIRRMLLGDTGEYEKILKKHAAFLSDKYPERHLSRWFKKMPFKLVTLGPMANCDALLSDLGSNAPDNLLGGIGLMSFHISSYDDIVDETPASKEEIAALAYSGNIALIEGMELMVSSGLDAPLYAALGEIKKNSYMQQKITGILWKEHAPKAKDYFEGIKHIISWASIGPMSALAYAKKTRYSETVGSFCENYGIAMQIIDDVNEIEEDLRSGYWSLPIIEAKRIGIDIRKESSNRTELIDAFRAEAFARLSKARAAIPDKWSHLISKVDMLDNYMKGI